MAKVEVVKGGNKLKKKLAEIARKLGGRKQVRVGFLEGATYPDGTSVPMVAAIQEFGAPAVGIPPRPYFRTMVAEKEPGWGKATAACLKASGMDAKKALALMGEGISGQLRQSIEEFEAVPNSPVTNLLKQRFPTGDGVTFGDVQQARADVAEGATAPAGKPLVWSGHLLASVDYEVKS